MPSNKENVLGLLKAFEAFVNDSLEEGLQENFPDASEFLKGCLEVFIGDEDFLGEKEGRKI